jgi:Rps23 Pro-64 3,4-dihydroxylase Tpa1-like proline 4-hydroxylase
MIENEAEMHVWLQPFPHAVIDNAWPDELLNEVVGEFPDENNGMWKRFGNSTERKLEGSQPAMFGPSTRMLLALMEARAPMLQRAFNTPPLTMEIVGGGYHWIRPGGYLQMHADFSRSPATGRYRWLNMLVYLNEDWQEEPGGCLQLWDDNGEGPTIRPEFNRTVIFQTSATSWHGHPAMNDRDRRSIAAYFYADEPAPGYAGDHSTRWHPKAGA